MSSKPLTLALLALALSFAATPVLFAGPAAIQDYSKDKEVPVRQEQICDPRWYVSVGGGGDFNIGNTALNQEVRAFGLAPFTSAFIERHDFTDVYSDGWHAEGEIGYALTQHLEVFGNFHYAHAAADQRTTGSRVVTDFSPFGGPTFVFPLSSEFDDYNSWGGELGFRWFLFERPAKWRPYFAVSGGASHVDKINISTFVDFRDIGGPADVRVFHGGFFDDSWVGTGAAVLGMEYNVTCHWTLGVNGGVRYATRLEQSDSDLRRASFTVPNGPTIPLRFATPSNDNAGDRWTVPVTGYVKFRF